MDMNSIPDGLILTQVRLLSCIGMMYCGDQRLVERAKNGMSDLIAFCNTEWPNYMPEARRPLGDNSSQVACDWELWCQAESHRRTGYSIWVRFNIFELFTR